MQWGTNYSLWVTENRSVIHAYIGLQHVCSETVKTWNKQSLLTAWCFFFKGSILMRGGGSEAAAWRDDFCLRQNWAELQLSKVRPCSFTESKFTDLKKKRKKREFKASEFRQHHLCQVNIPLLGVGLNPVWHHQSGVRTAIGWGANVTAGNNRFEGRVEDAAVNSNVHNKSYLWCEKMGNHCLLKWWRPFNPLFQPKTMRFSSLSEERNEERRFQSWNGAGENSENNQGFNLCWIFSLTQASLLIQL